MNKVRDDLTSLKECLTSLNETIIQLSGDLEEHKNWTRYELADLDSSIDNLSDAVLQTLLPYTSDIEETSGTDLGIPFINDRIDTTVSRDNERQRTKKTRTRPFINDRVDTTVNRHDERQRARTTSFWP